MIVMCDSMPDDQVIEVMRLGIRGLVLKSSPVHAVIACLRAVRRGGTYFDQLLVERAMVSMLTRDTALRELGSVLTAKELEVVRMVGLGSRTGRLRNAYS